MWTHPSGVKVIEAAEQVENQWDWLAQSVSTPGQTQAVLTNMYTAEVCLTVEFLGWYRLRSGTRAKNTKPAWTVHLCNLDFFSQICRSPVVNEQILKIRFFQIVKSLLEPCLITFSINTAWRAISLAIESPNTHHEHCSDPLWNSQTFQERGGKWCKKHCHFSSFYFAPQIKYEHQQEHLNSHSFIKRGPGRWVSDAENKVLREEPQRSRLEKAGFPTHI